MLAHVPSFGRNPRGSPDFMAYPVPKACMHVLGTRVPRRLGVARSASSPKAAQALGCSLTPGLRISFGRVTCMARAASVPGLWALGFLLLACVCGWVRVAVGRGFCLPLPVVAGVLGGCVWARFVVLSLFCRLFVVFVVGLWCGPAFGTCVVSCAFPLPPAVSGSGVRCGRPGLGCAPPFLAGLSGCVFCAFFFFFFSGCWVSLSRALWSLPRLLSFGGCWLFFFFLLVSVSFFFFPLGRCRWLGVAGLGWVVPLCLFGGPVFGALWVGGLAPFCVVGGRFGGCGLFSRARPPPPFFFFFFFFFFGGGGLPGCSSRCLPSAGGCSVAGVWCGCPSPLLAEVPVCYSPPLLAGFRCRWLWAVPATPGWGLPAAVVSGVWRWCVGGVVAGVWCGWSLATPGGGSCVLLPATPGWVSLPVVLGGPRHSWLGSVGGVAVWCVVRGGGVLVGLWLVCGVVGPSPLLAEVPVCYSPPLLAGFRCRWWWAVPATPGWGPLAAVVCGVWCVVCGGGVWVGLWLVCGVVGPSPLLAEVPVCYSPPLLAGFRFRWWWAVPATPGWGPLAALLFGVWCVAVVCWWGCGWWVVWLVPRHSWRRFLCATPRHSWLGFASGGGGRSPPLLAGVRWRRCCVVCGVWRWCVGGVVAGVWCGWSLATPGCSCVLLPATPGWVSLPVVVGGPRHSWLGSVGGVAVWCVVCGAGVLVGLWLACGVVGPSPLLAEVPVCYSPPLLAGFRFRWWWAVPPTPGWGPLAALLWCVVCGGGVLVGLWLVCGVVGPSPLLAEVPVCYSPPLLAGFRFRWWWAVPATPGWGPLAALLCGVWCVALVCWWGCGWRVVWLVPRHSWLFLCATPRHSWLGFASGGGGRSPPLLAGVLWRRWCVVCCWGPSPLLAEVPVCYSPPLLAGFRCRWWWAVPATPGWGPLAAVVCVFCLAGSGGPASRARCGAPHLFLWPLCLSALLGPLRAGVAPLSFAAVAVSRWLGFVVCGLAVAWHLFVCRGSLRVVRALRVCGTRRPSLLGTCPCALVVAGGVPLWRASWPRVVRRASSGPVALGAPVGFPDAVVPFPTPGACAPGFTGRLRGARGGRPRTGLIVPAAGPRRGRGAGLSASYPFGAPRWGCPWRVPPASVLGCVRCGGWRVWTRSLTRPVSRTVRLSTGDSAGAPGLFRVDADTSPCGSEDATPGSRACLRVRAFLAGSGGPASRARSGAPHLFLWPLCLSALLGPLRAGVAPLFFAAVAFPRWLFFSASRCLARASFVSSAWPLAALWWLLPRPAPLCVSGFRRSCLWPWCFFFFFFFFSLRAPPLSLAFSGFRPRVPWASALALFVLLAFRFSALRAPVPLSCFPLGCWLLPRGCCPPPPPLCPAVFVPAARCCVPCCAVRPLVRCGAAPRCCALCRPVLCWRVLCCARLVPLLVAPCPLALPVALGPCALRRCVLRCSPALCALCVLSWRGGACCAFPVLSVLCGAVLRCAGALALCCSCGACCCWRLVLWCAAVCCAVSCGVPWCGAGSGGPWLSAGGVFRCRCPCLAAWSASLCLVWFAVVPCFPVSCSVVLCCRVVLCCCALLSCCGAVGACFALLWAVVLCCVVLLVGCAVFGPVVVSACCGALFLALCVPCLLRSVRCGALLCWLWCPASLCRVLCRCAVVWCCAVVPCCRFAVLFVFALPSCGLSCGACVVCAVVGASCCGVSLCVVVSPWAFCGVVVLLWCVVVSCCAVRCPVVSCALCRVLRCRAVLPCCAGWLCCAVVCAAGVCFVLFSFAKNPCRFSVPLKTLFVFFFFCFFFFENKIKLYTTQHTRVQQDHVRGCALRVTRRS